MGKHTTGGGRRTASARAFTGVTIEQRARQSTEKRIDDALTSLGFSRDELMRDFDTNYRITGRATDAHIVEVTGTENGTLRMTRAIGKLRGATRGGLPKIKPNGEIVSRWTIPDVKG